MVTYTFEEVSVTATKRWKDAETGRARQKSKRFYQTLNPYNRNADGSTKNRQQIMAQITAQRDSWLATTP